MTDFTPVLLALGKLFLLISIGFAVFRFSYMRDHFLKPILWITMNVLLPVYSVYYFSAGWDDAIGNGPHWMVIFFGACIVLIALQVLIGRLFVSVTPHLSENRKRDMTVLIGMHNAGYLPLPLLTPIVPDSVIVYVLFFLLAFMLLFWTIAVGYIGAEKENGRFRFKLNMPLIGIIIGLVTALTGSFKYIPHSIVIPMKWTADVGINLIVVVLGGVLASIPQHQLHFQKKFIGVIITKMILFPLLIIGVMALAPIEQLVVNAADPKMLAKYIRLVMIVEAAAPPATNLIIVSKVFGTDDQVAFMGNGILHTYIAAVITMPVFVAISLVIFP